MSDDDHLFEQAMRDVEPLGETAAGLVPRRRRSRGRRTPPRRRKSRFDLERHGERIEALAAGGDRGRLRALARGEIPVDLRLDLHRLTEEEARGEVEGILRQALDGNLRCVLIIHGRGLRSPLGPVLKEALPDWLTGSPLASRILAFVTSPPSLGGEGSTLVLLRQRRGRRSPL